MSELRTAFVHAVHTAQQPVTQAVRHFGTSRKTAYILERGPLARTLHRAGLLQQVSSSNTALTIGQDARVLR